MPSQFFITLPVADLDRSAAFFTALGFRFDPKFANDSGVCLIVTDNVCAMLVTKPFFATLTPKSVVDAKTQAQALLCIGLDSREAVDAMAAKAAAAGGTLPHEPEDYGFMYQHGFEDLDGHGWGLVHSSGAPG